MRDNRTRLLATAAIIIAQLMIACGGLSSKQKVAADDAVKSLKKIEAATQVGVNFAQYSQLVIDAKTQANEVSSVLPPNSELRKEIEAAMESYMDAAQAWNAKFGSIYTLLYSNTDPGKTLIPKYQLKVAPAIDKRYGDYASPDQALPVIWAAAHPHVDRAASLLNQ